ncbi:MAG: glycosyltransferase [Acidobacteria bacterium]|nr:glycosyltransferase [Acidobacteriota bacterium]
MKRLLVYSHDTYGLGNVRRMLAVSEYLLDVIPDLSILLITGSPVIHSLRLPEKLDYIKLPCLHRVGRGEYTTRYLSASLDDVIRLRADLIRAAVAGFRPDLFLVDKKPLGVKAELAPAFQAIDRLTTRTVLVLRDILDDPTEIRSNWRRYGHDRAMDQHYDEVLVLGERRIFDPVVEYGFSANAAAKTVFCGYIRRASSPSNRNEVRKRLGITDAERLVLVTPGGGHDGYEVMEAFLRGRRDDAANAGFRSVVVCGPEMPVRDREALRSRTADDPGVDFFESTGEMPDLMSASDLVVAMGGYNTICEILSLEKAAVIVPRCRPTEEQWMRAERMSRLGLIRAIHPDKLTPALLMSAVRDGLVQQSARCVRPHIDLDGLPRVAARVSSLLHTGGQDERNGEG